MEVADGMGSSGRSDPAGSVESYLQNYRLEKTLGVGSFAKVRLAEHVLTKQKVAIKILNRLKMQEEGMEEKVIREITIMRILMHPHIVQLYEVIETPTDIFMVMEYMRNGELYDYITQSGRLREDEARHFFQQIVSGVEFCHRNMIVHRDLKPDNLLLDSTWNVKIIDFGLGNIMRDGHFLRTRCGTLDYAAPELLLGNLYAGPEVDVWSCGIILYALLCGGLPFDGSNYTNLLYKIQHGIYILPSHLSPGARDLITNMLQKDPMKRVTISEIRQHPWFQAHLPRYLAVPPLDSNQQAKRIDDDILQTVINAGFAKNHVLESLHNRVQNQATVVYYLTRDKLRCSEFSYGYLEDHFEEEREGVAQVAHMDPQVQNSIGRTGLSGGFGPGSSNQSHASLPSGSQRRGQAERKWALGLQSQESPRRIMMDVLKTLHGLQVSWKNVGSYCLKCRWVPPVVASRVRRSTSTSPMVPDSGLQNPTSSLLSGTLLESGMDLQASSSSITAVRGESQERPGGEDQCVVKFEVQLYKVSEGNYLLDLQRVEGPLLLFLDFYASFSTELQILSFETLTIGEDR